MNILVAEDEPRNRDMLVRRLLRRGYTVIEAENGQEAVSKAQEQTPDMILMDIAMPIVNGWDALDKIHALYPDMPVIILSAHSMVDDSRRAMRAGAKAYLTKPVDFEKLLEAIEKHKN